MKKIFLGITFVVLLLVAGVCGWFLNSKFDANDKKEVGTIVLKCEDQTYQTVPDGTYDLRSEDGLVMSATADEKGMITFEDISVGSYTIVSTSIPDGYELPYPETEIDLQEGKKVSITKTYKRIVPRLVLTVEDEDGNPIKDAKIELYNEEEYILNTGYTNEEGLYTFNFDTTGTYYMQQLEAPDGYVKDDTLYRLTLDEDDNFTFYTTIVNQYETGEESLAA